MKNILLILILSTLYFTTGKLSLDLSSLNNIITVGIFLPEGIALAFTLYFGKKVIPGVFLGQFFLAYINGIDILPSLSISGINSLEALLGIMLFQELKLNKDLREFRDIIGLILIIALVLQPFSAILSNAILLVYSHIEINMLLTSILAWWFGNVMGQLLLTPFILILLTRYKKIDLKNYMLYIFLFFVYLYIIEIFLEVTNPFLLLSLSIPIAIFIVAYKDMIYGTLFSVIATVVTSFSVYIGIGAFHANSTLDNTINYNLFIFSHIVIILIFGVLFEEKKRREETLQALVKEEVNKNKEQQLLMFQQNRLAQMGEMISMIAHQWRQPLNNLSLINQLLISKFEKNKLDDASMSYFKNNSKKQVDLMSKTIDDFRNFFKSEKEKEQFIVNDMIYGVLDMTKNIYVNSGIEIKFHSESRFEIYGYPNTLAQAILNIINNAKDALLDSDVENKKIEIILSTNKEILYINIKDNAGGIPEHIIDKIFDPYFSTKEDKNGTGLGLYMSKMIINEQGNAAISVKNNPDGANFEIALKGTIDVKS